MNITHTRFVTVPVSDQDRAKQFYAGTLGFEVVADHQMGPVRWLGVAPKGERTYFVLASESMGFTPGTVRGTMLVTSSLDADCAELRAAGVEVEGPVEQPWGRQATLKDPDGNAFVLTEES
ncbi:VOC family protein [Streptomyces sp. NPDC051940]|uniref:VOC family protein n=1 Tax=Streptomyces sp. NPDC051940 TaxID=3155675 RepID=UPI0034210D8C